MEPDSCNPYQPPKDPGPPPEKQPEGLGGQVPLAGAIIVLASGGYSAPSFSSGWVALTFAVAGSAMASNKGQRFLGVALSALSLLAIFRAWPH